MPKNISSWTKVELIKYIEQLETDILLHRRIAKELHHQNDCLRKALSSLKPENDLSEFQLQQWRFVLGKRKQIELPHCELKMLGAGAYIQPQSSTTVKLHIIPYDITSILVKIRKKQYVFQIARSSANGFMTMDIESILNQPKLEHVQYAMVIVHTENPYNTDDIVVCRRSGKYYVERRTKIFNDIATVHYQQGE